jgi:hypothetical protein
MNIFSEWFNLSQHVMSITKQVPLVHMNQFDGTNTIHCLQDFGPALQLGNALKIESFRDEIEWR